MMKTNPTRKTSQGSPETLLAIAVLGLAALVSGTIPATASAQSFDNVQIFVNTTASLPYSFTYTAYNLTGSLIATYQAQYPAASFEVPPGDYLFTVSAVYQKYVGCYECPVAADGQTAPGGSASPLPPVYVQPSSEYGYLLAHVDGPKTYTISTMNVTTYPSTAISVKTTFVNGTAASGAYIDASVVGQWYYWWASSANGTNWAQTGADGTATLLVPKAPVVITGWLWVPVTLPPDQTTVVKDIGGQQVNVTVYWQPSYVGLSGSALLIPPSTSANITLSYQQPSYWAMPGGIQYAGTGSTGKGEATVANQPTGVPGQMMASTGSGSNQQFFVPQQIPQVSAPGDTTIPAGPSGLLVPLLVAGTIACVVVAATWLALSRRSRVPARLS